uniref:Uncharacterized protein n=1 Tax=Phlebotomus papatasi TaxID=29031 RepID=A0A1B0D5K0_PHLPP
MEVCPKACSCVALGYKDPPEISVERQVVFSGEGQEAALVCIVHGEAQPEVMWFKDTMQIDQTDRMITEARGARHTLIIRKVHAMDFGNFSCVADNQLGKSRKSIMLTGKPNVATFRSAPISQWRDKYNISWTVDCFTPIEEYKLYYKPIFSSQDQGHQMYGPKLRSPFIPDQPPSPAYDTFNYHAGYGNAIHWGKNEWRDILLAAVPQSKHYTQGMSYVIRNLDPDQQYEAKVQSR